MQNKLLWFVPIIMLLVALAPLPYAYYQIMRWVVCGCAAYIAYQHYQKVQVWDKFVVALVVIAIIYNPINPIHLFKEAWMVLNVLTVVILGYVYKSILK